MPGVKVAVEPAVMQWVLQVAREQGTDEDTLDRIQSWITGEKAPTFHQLEELSRKTNIPFGYFFLRKVPAESCEIVDYRTIDSLSVVHPSRNLLDTVDAMSRVQQWMSEYNRNSGKLPCACVGSIRLCRDRNAAAERIRNTLEIKTDWFIGVRSADAAFKELRRRIMGTGILVMMNGVVGNNTHRKLSTNEFRAFTMIDPYAPLIFINAADSRNGRLFSLLHELVHVMLGENSFYNDQYGASIQVGREEQFCNAVAAELLVPEKMFLEKWDETGGSTENKIAGLQEYFVCSSIVLLRKALDCKRISMEEYGRLAAKYEKQFLGDAKKRMGESGGDFYKTLKSRWDQNFIKALGNSVESGRTQYREAYYMTNTTGKTFSVLTESIGGYEIG